MRFTNLSFLFALSMGYTSALVAEPSLQACGINDIDDAKTTDCETLLDNTDIWNEATKDGLDFSAESDGVTKFASFGQCHLFHRYGLKTWDGFNNTEIRLEARSWIHCHGGDTVNGRAVYRPDPTSSKSHYLCITGNPKQGKDCLGDDDDDGGKPEWVFGRA